MGKKQRREQKKANRILAVIFIAVLIGFFVVNLAVRDRASSELENRSLSQVPKVTWQGITSGTFMDRFETYESDQFVGRDAFREIYTFFRRVGGKHEENGVYLGKKQQLLEDISVPEAELLSEDVEGLNNYSAAHPDVTSHILLVPDTASILENRLPAFVTVADQDSLFDDLNSQLDPDIVWMDAASALRSDEEDKLYYKTDPHWTTEAAYRVFLDTASDLGIDDPEATEYETYCATADFNGTLASTSGFHLGLKETIDVMLPVNETSYIVTYEEEQERTPSVYNVDSLGERDKYAVFFGGNHPLIDIETASEDDRVLLVVKDSFANCYIPFLIPHYGRIIVVDPRYYAGGIEEVTETYGVTDTLFLYSGNTFFTDTNLNGFLDTDAGTAVAVQADAAAETAEGDEVSESDGTEVVLTDGGEVVFSLDGGMPSLDKLKQYNYTEVFSDCVILGDSIARGLDTYEILPSSEVFAVDGVYVGEVDSALVNAASMYPKKAFFTYGLNDMDVYKDDLDLYREDYTALLTRARELMPDTEFYVTLLLPVNDYALSNHEVYGRRDEYNEVIKEICGELGITWMDLSFTYLDEYYDDDGIHPYPDFYYGWLYYMALGSGLL